jgi:hypothetical protein
MISVRSIHRRRYPTVCRTVPGMIPSRPGLTFAVVVALIAIAVQALGTTASGQQTYPKCFGAASRDPALACDDPALRFRVIPTPDFAPILPNSPCTPIRSRAQPNVCWFGHKVAGASADVALLGDSHAAAWRSAVAVAARAERWHGLTVRHSSCTFTMATRAAPPSEQKACTRWVFQALGWFRRHPEVHTVFVASSSFAGVAAPAGADWHQVAVKGERDAFNALPASVQHIIVLRDSPRATDATLPCVARALARHQRADLRCTLQRSKALLRDAGAEAALQMASPRVQLIDLTDFFCDPSVCYSVIGGALVFKDISHLTDTFSTTLGPYLLAKYRQLQNAN